MSKVKAKFIELRKNGKLLAKIPYYGDFEGGLHRYYAPQFGYKYGANVDVFINGKKMAVINGGFRDGIYR